MKKDLPEGTAELICPRCGAEVEERDRGWSYCPACDTWTKTFWCRKQAQHLKELSHADS